VFSESTVLRKAAGAHVTPPLDAQQKQFIREAMNRFLKPYAKAGTAIRARDSSALSWACSLRLAMMLL
jgi:hypothetical protein